MDSLFPMFNAAPGDYGKKWKNRKITRKAGPGRRIQRIDMGQGKFRFIAHSRIG